MEKNTAGKWVVFAYGLPENATPGLPITGDAANITANIRIDGGAANAVDDTNPTELEDGYYIFDITAAESNGDNLLLTAQSVTPSVQVIAVPGAVWTRPPNFSALDITSGAVDVGKWDGADVTSATLGLITEGTAQSATAVTIVLEASEAYLDDEIIGASVHIETATAGAGQTRLITDWSASSRTATVDLWNTTPTNTVTPITYKVYASPPGSASNPVDVNISTINEVEVIGAGTAGDKWRA